MLVREKCLCMDEVVQVLKACERYGSKSPFNAITILNTFCVRGKSKDAIKWCFIAMDDLLLSKEIRLTDISVRFLAGDSSSRGFIDVLLVQREFKDYFLGAALLELKVKPEVQQKLKRAFGSHKAYRTHVRGVNGEAANDVQWTVGLPLAVSEYADFIEAIVYQVRSSEYNPIIKQGIRNKKTVMDILDYETLKEKWTVIKDNIAKMVEEETAKDDCPQEREIKVPKYHANFMNFFVNSCQQRGLRWL